MAEDGEVPVVVHKIDALVAQVEAGARDVFAEVGAGVSEGVYRNALAVYLRAEGLSVAVEAQILVHYRGETVGCLRADVIVDGRLVVELKVVARISDAHVAQARAYTTRLQAEGPVGGLVVNFTAAGVETRHV